ncbi:MAG: hypothetical protein HY751_03050 [Nitrospinae bacterium]|nr:hypothetical protein [Nitrospinota bacterium]
MSFFPHDKRPAALGALALFGLAAAPIISLAGCGGASLHAGVSGSRSVKIMTVVEAHGMSDPEEAGALARKFINTAPAFPEVSENE